MHLGHGHGPVGLVSHVCTFCGVRDREAVSTSLCQHAICGSIQPEGSVEGPPRHAGIGALPVHGFLSIRTFVPVSIALGGHALPTLLSWCNVVVPRALVLVPTGPGEHV